MNLILYSFLILIIGAVLGAAGFYLYFYSHFMQHPEFFRDVIARKIRQREDTTE